MKIGTLIKAKSFAPKSSKKNPWRLGLIIPNDPWMFSNIKDSDRFVTILWQDDRNRPQMIARDKIEILSVP